MYLYNSFNIICNYFDSLANICKNTNYRKKRNSILIVIFYLFFIVIIFNLSMIFNTLAI